MTTTADLRNLAALALMGKTQAQNNIYSPRTWSTWQGDYPVIMVRAQSESGDSFGRNGAPAFTVTSVVQISARLQIPAMLNNAGAAQIEADLEIYREQIKSAIINNPSIMVLLQQYPYFKSTISLSDDGEEPIGEVVVEIAMEFVQGPEDFYPVSVVSLQGVDVTVPEPAGTPKIGASINLAQ